MKFSKKIVTESLDHPNSGIKVYTEGKRQSVILSEEQFERLISTVNESKEKEIANLIKESHKLIRESIISESLDLGEQGQYNRDPGVAAGEGLEVVLDGIKKAYDMIKDSDTRKKLANSITKLGNFMTITADAIASGRDQRGMTNPDSLRDPLPYPELDEGDDKEMGEAHHEMDEGAKPDFLDLDGDGDKEESMKKAAKDKLKEEKEEKEKLLQEEINKMKQIIKPIAKI